MVKTLVIFFLSATIASAAPLVIVENGQPRAVIVVVAGEPKADRAALAIQQYVEKMSGAKLAIVKAGEPVSLPIRISVGRTAAGFNPAIRPEAFDEEEYVLKTQDQTILVAGNCAGPYQGTIFAAYAFLEKLGCRWFFPGEWGEVVPKQSTLTVPELNITARPDFPVRNIWLSGWVKVTPAERKIYADWGAKIGFSATLYPTVGDGFLGALLPPKEYAESHPEFYALNKQGDRKVTPKSGQYFSMLCLSNPGVFTQSVANLKAAFAGEMKLSNVSSNGFGISPPDGAPYCYCDPCVALSQNFSYPTYIHERMLSEEFFGFAARLALEFPAKWCATMAYALREMPPQGVKLPANVAVTYAPISSCVLHPGNDPGCWRRLETMKLIAQWRKLTPHVIIYDYNPGFLTGSFLPDREVANLTVNAPLYKQIGIKGMNREGRKAFMQTWLSYYITGKLLWDSHADVAAIKQDFYATFFGAEAGPHIQAWWDACEDALGKATGHFHEDWLVNHIYTVEFTTKIHAHVEAARQAKATDEQRARFEAFAVIADHLENFAAMNAAEKNLDYAKAAVAAGRMVDDQEKLSGIYSFFLTPDKSAKPQTFFAQGRKKRFEELAARPVVAALPAEMKFARDRFNEGVISEWYAPGFDDKNWGTKNTFLTWDQQDPPEDNAGHDYDGFGWYRGTFEIPGNLAGKPIKFWSGGAINEAWVWINGEFAGHKKHALWWMHPHEFELDVTALSKPGRNTIAIRVFNDAEIGGLYRRGFFWSPKE